MIDEKNLKNLSGIDSEIKPILVDLHEIYE